MNIFTIFAFVIVLTSGTQTFVIEESTTLKTTTEQRTLLKKLQNSPQSKNETKPLMWNEILADVLVNKVKIFSLKRDNITTVNEETQHSALTKWFGTVLIFYKHLIYDKFVYTPKERNVLNIHELSETEDEVKNDGESDTNLQDEEAIHHLKDTLVNDKMNSTNPKADIEIIEPKYHGKLTDGDTERPEDEDKAIVCPEGYVKSDRGCLDANSRLVLAIPNQCPNGYRLDRLGYCRMMFTFNN